MAINYNAEWQEQGSAPDNPATGNWKIFFKSDGLYILEDDGTEHGPFNSTISGSSAGEIFIGSASIWPSSTTGAAASVKTEYGTNDVDMYLMAFDQTTQEYGQFTVWMPDSWDGGTITFRASWTAASGTGNVIWGLQARCLGNDDAIDDTWGTAQTLTDGLIATGDMHISSESSAITIAGTPVAGEVVQFRVYRDADDGSDTLDADALLIGIKIYYVKG